MSHFLNGNSAISILPLRRVYGQNKPPFNHIINNAVTDQHFIMFSSVEDNCCAVVLSSQLRRQNADEFLFLGKVLPALL